MSGETKDPSSPVESPPQDDSGTDNLQFDTAAYEQPAAFKTCSGCQQSIADTYFELGGKIICTPCRDKVQGGPQGRADFWRALLFGGLAAAVGTLIWALIIYLTGYELGLIAIFIGVGIGMAVRKGSRGRGGRKYQALAMILTYISITTSYVPMVWKGMMQGLKNKEQAAEVATTSAPVTGEPSSTPSPATGPAPAPATPGGIRAVAAVVLFLAVMWGIALAAPFLAGLSNILGLFILGIGLYEAWKLNRRVPLSGPYHMTQAAPPSPGTP